MRIKVVGMCRGDGRGYVALLVEDFQGAVAAFARTKRGDKVPAQIMWIDQAALLARLQSETERVYNVVCMVPLLTVDLTVEVYDEAGDIKSFEFAAGTSKLMSRFAMTFNKNIALAIRDFDAQKGIPYAHVRFTDVFEHTVRAEVYAHDPGDICVFDLAGRPLDAEVYVLDDVIKRRRGVDMRELTVSVNFKTLPAGLLLWVKGAGGGPGGCFNVLGENYLRQLRNAWWAETLDASRDYAYDAWMRQHRTSWISLEATRAEVNDDLPHVGVVIMGCNLASRTAYANTMASLEQQVFRARYVMRVGQDTFRVSEVAQALDVDLVCFVRAGDTLEPDALITYVRGARDYPETCMWYSDTDILKKRTFIEPNIRPELSFEDMTSAVGWESGVCFRSDVLKAIVEASNHDHMGVYETVLAAYAQNMQFFHIERVLFHLKEIRKPKLEIEGAALTRYLAQVGIKAEVALVATGGLRLLYDTTGAGLVSIVVLSRNNAAHLRACIDSIKQQTPRMRYEIVVADWGAHGDELEAYYRELMHDTSVRLVALASELTYAQAINAAVAASAGEYVLLLQQDLRVLNVDWLEALLGPLMRDEVGVTSAKILYPDGLVQHAGMQTTPGGDFVFVNQNLDKHDAGYMYTLQRNVAYSVVTGACQLIKRALFDELGGYDEGYATTMCEYEFCLKVRASGHTVVVVNDAVMEHELYDARNRHAQTEEEQIERFHDKSLCMAAHPAAFALGDPAQNRQLIPTSGYFALQW